MLFSKHKEDVRETANNKTCRDTHAYVVVWFRCMDACETAAACAVTSVVITAVG